MTTMRGRATAFTAAANTGANVLIQPSISNLTFTSVPTDSTGVVVCRPNSLGITDKIDSLLQAAAPEMVRLANNGGCASDITANVPRELIRSLYDMLNVSNHSCLPDTQTFLQVLVAYLNQTTSGPVAINRAFWNILGRVFSELNRNENKVNTSASGLRSMSMAISSDAQTLPSNAMLLSTLNTISNTVENAIPVIDGEFEAANSEFIQPQPDPTDMLSEVINQIPTTIGESSTTPPTNMMEVSASDASENIQLYDLDDSNTLEGQTYLGLRELFSIKALTTSIATLHLTRGGKITITVPTVLKLLTEVELADTTLNKTYFNGTMMVTKEVDLSTIDLNKSLLQQDWAFTLNNGSLSNGSKWISTYDILYKPQLLSFTGEIVFNGINSRKNYTLIEVQTLSTQLSSLWSKIVNMRLPSPEHIQMGTNILAAGLGVAGQVFGSSGLLTASKLISSLNQGLGAFIADLQPTNGLNPTPQSSIPKASLSIIPCVVEAGKAAYEGISLSAQHQRTMLHGIKNKVESGYILPTTQLQNATSIRRYKQSFY